jgi:c-di-GMP-binding flagellar brake protein YcgR
MISKIKKAISSRIPKKSLLGPAAPDTNSNPKFVTDPEKILKVLNAITENSVWCTIPTIVSNEVYSTQIIEVIEGTKLLTLKPLDSSQGNQALKHHKQLKLTTHFNDIHISILLKEIVAHKIQHSPYYQTPFPLRIYYPQRRQFIRIDTSNFHLTFQGVSDRTRATIGGTVENRASGYY